MSKRFRIIPAVIILLVLVAVISLWQFNRLLVKLDIQDLDIDVDNLGIKHLNLSALSFARGVGNSRQIIALRDIQLKWAWPSPVPHVTSIEVAEAEVRFINKATSLEPAPPTFSMPADWSVPQYFPSRVDIHTVKIHLPCPTGECHFAGQLHSQLVGQRLQVSAKVSPGLGYETEHHLQLDADYGLVDNLPALQLSAKANNQLDLHFSTSLKDKMERRWLGNFVGTLSYPDSWWGAQLAKWNLHVKNSGLNQSEKNKGDINEKKRDQQKNEQPGRSDNKNQGDFTIPNSLSSNPAGSNFLNLKGEWDFALMPLLNLIHNNDPQDWYSAISGQLNLDAHLPAPVSIEGYGAFSGDISFKAQAHEGIINNYNLSTSIKIDQWNLADFFPAYGLVTDSVMVSLSSRRESEVSFSALPLQVELQARGDFSGDFTGDLVVDVIGKNFLVEKFMLTGTTPKFHPGNTISFAGLDVVLQGRGGFRDRLFELSLDPGTKISADIDAPDFSLQAKSTKLDVSQLELEVNILETTPDFNSLQLKGKFSLSTAQLVYPQLKPVEWSWKGDVDVSPLGAQLQGDLTLDKNLNTKHHLKGVGKEFEFDWQLADVFLLAGNSFANLIDAWPPLLTLTQGRIKAEGSGQLSLETNTLNQSQTNVQLTDVTGIYDTLAFQGITGSLAFNTQEKNLEIFTDDLGAKQINKGIDAGPMSIAGSYQCTFDQPGQGNLSLKKFRSDIMGGYITTAARNFNLREPKQNFTVDIHEIELASLLQQHPSSDLSGSGLISGSIPIEISSSGVSVPKGIISALPPGGQLKFQSAQATRLAQAQPGMKVITDALKDFHYTVLSSEVSYDGAGKLNLAVRLEGKNPELENGRPINFNINLEEDVPAMIASLQLTNQISDVIKKRVQERLQPKKSP